MGKFDWGFRYVIIFRYVQFWILLAAVSYRGKKIRTVASPAVRSVNKSRDARNCVQNECAICVILIISLYHKALGLILCDLIWQIHHDYTRLDDGHCDATGHRKMSVLGAVGTMVTANKNFVMMWLFKGPKLFLSSAKPIRNEREWWVSYYGVVYKLNVIANLSRISDWSLHSRSYFFCSTGTVAVSTDSPLRR